MNLLCKVKQNFYENNINVSSNEKNKSIHNHDRQDNLLLYTPVLWWENIYSNILYLKLIIISMKAI